MVPCGGQVLPRGGQVVPRGGQVISVWGLMAPLSHQEIAETGQRRVPWSCQVVSTVAPAVAVEASLQVIEGAEVEGLFDKADMEPFHAVDDSQALLHLHATNGENVPDLLLIHPLGEEEEDDEEPELVLVPVLLLPKEVKELLIPALCSLQHLPQPPAFIPIPTKILLQDHCLHRVKKISLCLMYLADPGEARGCSTNTFVINSFIH